MTETILNDVLAIADSFVLDSAPAAAKECRVGHINSTYFITGADGEKYVLQRINTGVFKDPDVVMNNVIGVTDHIRGKLVKEGGDVRRGTLHFRLDRKSVV